MKTPKKLIKRLSAVLMAGIMFAGAAAVRAEGVPSVSASSALLLDAGSGRVIFEKDADTERPMASTTKIMTALIAVERCDLKRPSRFRKRRSELRARRYIYTGTRS